MGHLSTLLRQTKQLRTSKGKDEANYYDSVSIYKILIIQYFEVMSPSLYCFMNEYKIRSLFQK